MEIHAFVNKFKPFADAAEKATGISSLVTLAQAACESAWGEKAPNNNFFGIKSFNVTDKRALVPTFEYNKDPNLTPRQIGLDSIVSVAPSTTHLGYYIYKGPAWFRVFDTPEEAFDDHAHIFYRNHLYAPALAIKSDPEAFVKAMAHYYAQAPNYASLIIEIMNNIKKAEQ
jgi:flagellum-specific peptidoglycan hydrolase FlgJ